MKNRIVTFWAGDRLPPLYTVCIASWLANGYEAAVYSYNDTIGGIPSGAELKDARQLFEIEQFYRFQYKNGVPHFSDVFRMELLRRDEGVWCDTDYLAIRRFPEGRGYILGGERGGWPCNAVMWFPSDHRMPREILDVYRSGRFAAAPWSYAKTRWRAARATLSGRRLGLGELPHGHWGRHALLHYTRKLKLRDEMLPDDAFFAPETYTNELLEAGNFQRLIEDPGVYGVHFFSKKGAKAPPVKGSFYAWAAEKYAAFL